MQSQAILEVIADQSQRRFLDEVIKRECLEGNAFKEKNPFVHIFSGVRRCGKSTLLHFVRSIESDRDYYMNFDDERLVDFHVSDFQKLYELFIEKFGEQDVFYFDEIQNVQGWERFVRRLHDEGKKVYVTGSNANLLSKELGTHLTGRYIKTELYPFSFKEYLDFKCQSPSGKIDLLSTAERANLNKNFLKFVKDGGFPEYLKTQNGEYLKQLYESVIYKDIVVRYKLPNEKILKELGLYCASNIGKLISFNNLKNLFGAGSATTIKEYLEYFENSYLFFSINKFDYSLKKQIYAPKKVYCVDTGLAKEIGFRFSQDSGRYLENTVFLELKRRNENIFYHSGLYECDFVIQRGSKIKSAIQVSTNVETSERKEREFAGLVEAMESYNLNEGLLVTEREDGEEIVKINGKKRVIRIFPAWKWFLSKD